MNLKRFRLLAARKRPGMVAFLQKLDTIVPDDMPRLVEKKDREAWATVQCLECANCCKVMTPTFNRSDLIRISKHLGMTVKAFKEKWLKQDESNGDWVNTTQPCQFLAADNKCSIYEVRPKDCAEFPHHNKKPFDDYNETFINNIQYCPATFELVRRLKETVERDYEW